MPDDPSITFAQRQAQLAAIEVKSRARSAMSRTVGASNAILANRAALSSPQVAASYPGAVAVAAQSGDQANVDAVIQGGTKAKNDEGDWWSPGDALGAIGNAISSTGEAVGSAASAASAAISGTVMTGVKGVTRGVTAGAQSAWQLGENVFENRAPLSSDVAHMGLGNTKADEAARQAYGEQLGRISAGGITDPGGIVSQAKATDVGQIVQQAVNTGHVDMGTGFFPGASVATGQSAAARDVRGTITVPVGERVFDASGKEIGQNMYREEVSGTVGDVVTGNLGGPAILAVPSGGHTEKIYAQQARTIGRDLAVVYTEPGSDAYRTLSGFVDAAAVLVGDPINRLHPFEGTLTGASKTPLIANTNLLDQAKEAADETATWIANHPKASEDVKQAAVETADRLKGHIDAQDVKATKKAANQLSGLVARVEPGQADEATQFAAGLVDGVRKTIHAPTAEQWIQSNNDVLQRLADDNSFTSVFHRLNGKVDPRVVTELVDADTPEKVAAILRRTLGGEIVNAPGLAYRGQLGEASLKVHDWVMEHRLFNDMPGKELITDVRGHTSAELAGSVKTAEDALINARVPLHIRDDLVEKYARSLSGTSQDSFTASRAVLDAIQAQIEHGAANVPKGLARDIVNGMSDDQNVIRSYAKDRAGNPTDYGLADALRGQGLVEGQNALPGLEGLTSAGIVSPVQLEQGIRRAVDLPDARVIRRLTASPIMRALTTQGFEGATDAAAVGLQRAPISAVDWFTTNAFKRLAVMRLAFIPRVVGEETAYLGLAGGPSPFTHPIHFFQLAQGDTFHSTDALAEAFARAPKGTLPHEFDQFQQAINVSADLSDAGATTRMVHAAGDASIAHKGVDSERWIQGMSDHLAASSTNPLKRMVADGQSTDDIVGYLRSSKGSQDFKELQGMLDRKGVLYDDGSRLKLDLTSDAVLRTYIDTVVRGDVQRIAGDNPALLEAIAKRHIGAEEIPVKNSELTVISRGETNDGTVTWTGTKVRLKDGRVGVVTDEGANGQSVVQVGAPAWEQREPSKALKEALAEWQAHPDSADAIDVWTRPAMRRAMTDGDVISRAMQKVTRVFFGHLYGKASDYLVRAPFFKQTYWDEMEKMIPNLAPSEANLMLKTLNAQIAEHPGWLDDAQLGRVLDKAKSAGGTLDLEAADELAKGRALDTMHDTFYDWSRKGQFFDITRNLFPFGEAWKEMLTRYARLLKEDPVTTMRRAQLLVNGKNASGWFTRDPQTGLEKFNMPLVGPLSKILTGQEAGATATIQGMTLAADVIPGMGPAGQILVSNLLPDLPTTQGIEDVLFPYGRPKGSPTSLLPSWMQNAISAAFDKRNTTRLYGNTYYDIFKSLAASGNYNLSNQDEVSRLMDDAASRARPMAILKTVLQFVSPSSPTFDQVVKTKQGDVLSAMIIDDLDKMRTDDPDNYTKDFLDKYGEKAFIYLQGRTRATLGGLDVTTAFGNWEQTHQDAVQAHPDVAGYFAPTGGDFDFEVWRRQINNGSRTYLTDREIIDAAQATMARWQYYSVRDAMGPKVSQAQAVQLSELRKVLAKKYPGYDPSGDSTPSKVNKRVDELRDAAKMPDLAKTNVGQGLAAYFAARDAVDARAVKAGVTSFRDAKQFAPQREILRQLGEVIATKYPEFRRVWDDVLSREMKDDTPDPSQAAA